MNNAAGNCLVLAGCIAFMLEMKVPPRFDVAVSNPELKVKGDSIFLVVILDNCSSSCFILFLIDSISGTDA